MKKKLKNALKMLPLGLGIILCCCEPTVDADIGVVIAFVAVMVLLFLVGGRLVNTIDWEEEKRIEN